MRDGLIFVLAGGVPYLQFDFGIVEGYYLEDVVYAYGHHIILYELALRIS